MAGNATATNSEGPLCGQDLSKLIGVINEEAAYVKIHTADFTEGTTGYDFEFKSF